MVVKPLKAKSDAIAEKMVALIKQDEKAMELLMNAREISNKRLLIKFLNEELLPSLKANIKVADYANVRASVIQ